MPGQILKESERTFLANKLLGQSRDKVLFVINKIDLLDEDEKAQALAYARTQLAKLVAEPRVYAVSAEKALGGEREASGLGALERDLVRFLEEDRGRVLLDNALDEGLRTAVTLRRGIDVQKQALLLDHVELEKRLATLEGDLSSTRESHARREQKIREQLAGIKALVRKECEEFGKRFSASLPAEIESSKVDDLKRYLPNFMEERFRSFADRQGLELAKRLERVARARREADQGARQGRGPQGGGRRRRQDGRRFRCSHRRVRQAADRLRGTGQRRDDAQRGRTHPRCP